MPEDSSPRLICLTHTEFFFISVLTHFNFLGVHKPEILVCFCNLFSGKKLPWLMFYYVLCVIRDASTTRKTFYYCMLFLTRCGILTLSFLRFYVHSSVRYKAVWKCKTFVKSRRSSSKTLRWGGNLIHVYALSVLVF